MPRRFVASLCAVAVVVVVGVVGTSCTDDPPATPDPGGINGPARVDPNSGANLGGNGGDE